MKRTPRRRAVVGLSDESHTILQRLMKRTGRTQGQLIEDALTLLDKRKRDQFFQISHEPTTFVMPQFNVFTTLDGR